MAGYTKKDVVRILMRRDGLSKGSAEDVVDECQRVINDAIENECSLDELYDIIEDYLGLEPDYLDDFLF